MPISNSPTPKQAPKPQPIDPNKAVLDAYYALQDEMLSAHQAFILVNNAAEKTNALLSVWKTATKDPEIEDFDAIDEKFEALTKHVDSFITHLDSIKPKVAEFEKLLEKVEVVDTGDKESSKDKTAFAHELTKIDKALGAMTQSRGWSEFQKWIAEIQSFRTKIPQIRKLRLRELASNLNPDRFAR